VLRYVSVDVAFLINLCIDWPWFWLAGRLAGVSTRSWRIPVAAAGGAAAAVWSEFPTGWWIRTWWGMLLGTALWLLLAFAPLERRLLLRTGAYLLGVGMALYGAIQALWLWAPGLNENGLAAVGMAVGLAGARYWWEAARERRLLAGGLWELRVTLGGQSVVVSGLVDTGNHLKDPLAGTPVVVVEVGALQAVLPPELLPVISRGWEALEGLPGDWAARCRLVPFRTVGNKDGLLLALAADELALRGPGETIWFKTQALVGLAPFGLHPDGAYRALLPAELAYAA
jgi:stage II sporulation protein GA (sporulation sigma-E factor processing peptidase)